MKGLVLIGEGHGEVAALPVLANKILREKSNDPPLYVDKQIIRRPVTKLVRWDKERNQSDFSEWVNKLQLATQRPNTAAVLAVFDGDCPMFPAGSGTPFCAATGARLMAQAGEAAGAGKLFSLAVVFACQEYETWLIGSAESLAGRKLPDGRLALPPETTFPHGPVESHGKRWLEKVSKGGYLPARDQLAFTELLDPKFVRAKNLRSFGRMEHAIEELLRAVQSGQHICTPEENRA